MSADAPASGVLASGRGRGAPVRPVDQRMGAGADPDVVALAGCVQALARQAYPARTWSLLVTQLSDDERGALGGGDDRRLSSRLSAQFGAKARHGPNRPTIQAVVRHCLSAVQEDARESTQAEILALFRVVHGPDAVLTAAIPPRPRVGGLGVQLHQQRGENDLLGEQNRRLTQDNLVLAAEVKAARVRIQALEAQLAALSAPAAPRTVGIRAGADPQLVRPYIPEQRPADDRIDEDDPDDPAPARAFVTGPDGPRGNGDPMPPGSALANAHRAANTPRGFLPLQAFPHYPPDLTPPAVSTPAAPRIPRPRIVGRAPAPPGSRISAPRRGVTPASVWGAASTVRLPTPVLIPRPRVHGEPDAGDPAARRRARAEAHRLITGMRDAWAGQWAELPFERLPPETRGFAQMPLLLVAYVLATLIVSVPILLD